MRKKITGILLALLLYTCLTIYCNAYMLHSTPYIQYYDQHLGTATQIYGKDEVLIYDFGEMTAWRDVDQYIHAWVESGGSIVIPGSQYEVIDDAERVLGEICFDTSTWDNVCSVPVGVGNPLRFIARERDNPFGSIVREEKKYYLLDESGEILSMTPFDEWFRDGFYDGLLMVKCNDRWGYLNLNGEIAIQTQFIGCTPFYSGNAVVYIDSEIDGSQYSDYYIIDTQGEMFPVDCTTSYTNIYTNLLNIAEYYGIARGLPW